MWMASQISGLRPDGGADSSFTEKHRKPKARNRYGAATLQVRAVEPRRGGSQ